MLKKLFLTHYWSFAVGMSLLIFLSSSWSFPPQPPLDIPFYDKWLHMLTYACLGICYLNVATCGFTKMQNFRLWLGYLATVAYGASDEFHQSFVPGRHSDWQDLLADALGATLALGSVKVSKYYK